MTKKAGLMYGMFFVITLGLTIFFALINNNILVTASCAASAVFFLVATLVVLTRPIPLPGKEN